MLELIWRFRNATLQDESVLRPLIEAIADTPGFVPTRYDLNQREDWRDFDLDRAVVDALTQRTQLVRLQNQEGDALAMIALGKRDEQPTAIIRLPQPHDLGPLVGRWTRLYEALPLESTLVSSSEWRRALDQAQLPRQIAGVLLGMVFGWQRGVEPQGLSTIEPEDIEDSPIRITREANHLKLRLADEPGVVDDAHKRALERVARRLQRAGR